MQTPEEIARDIADRLPEHPMYDGLIDSDWLIASIAQALRAQAAALRERDAGIADKRAAEWAPVRDDDILADVRWREASSIAAAIRAQS